MTYESAKENKKEEEGILEEIEKDIEYLETKKGLSMWVWVAIITAVSLLILIITQQTGPTLR